ncbi:hemerythrin domain-containing protein [Streptomyces sp. HUAS TT20]|uniref:hemerythrin domain-containing protein n=1 Tax=Streptomyces sp. HUAS TT20 TaxID=3447509 RepID=UPI0021D9BB47|nr:hemerythrin domain-containing protein [Streptomyces sp. HUAS 15-9]UXY25323.1 hemerythrin domain-containing protein [Streptomyces sp. HUAS 15-9]
MGIETVAEALEREHHEIDEGIETFTAAIAGGTPDAQPLTRAVAALRRHIYLEEEFLFPPLRAAGLVMPVFVMVREHGQMWKILDALDDELRDGTVRASVADLLRDLQEELTAHNSKEEQILYPQTEQVLTVEAKAELQELLEVGRTPEGWVCEALRS